MLILDFSVVIDGYRSDFTNTLVVGQGADRGPAASVRPVHPAMAAGEKELRAGSACLTVYKAVRGRL